MVRAAFLICLGLALAVLSALQAASSVLANREPAMALTLMPSNGTAKQALLRSQLAAGIAQDSNPEAVAVSLERMAQQAFLDDPLGPVAYAVAVLSADTREQREARLAAAMQVNRRDLVLQGVQLQEAIRVADSDQTFATIDRMLRVHPEQQDQMFPVLEEALARPAAHLALSQVLDNSADWHSDFLSYAVREDVHAGPLARLRLAGLQTPEGFDRLLLKALERVGDLELAESVFASAAAAKESVNKDGVWNWDTNLPPFDWTLANKTGFRAQPSLTGERLELAVSSGRGGVIAERIFRRIEPPFSIVAEYQLEPASQARDVRLELRCVGAQGTLAVQRFGSSPLRMAVAELPTDCAFLALQIHARAWSDRSALSGSIGSIELER